MNDIARVIKRAIEVEKIICFGSMVVCSELPMNAFKDIDILIVSNFFEGISRFKRNEIINRICFSYNIDAICMTVDEFKTYENKSLFLNEILKNSKIL